MFKCGYLSGSLWVGNDNRHVYPCCFTNNKETRYKPPLNLNDEYLNNEILLDMRRTALRGDTPTLCKGCDFEKNKSLFLFKNRGNVKEFIDNEDIEFLHVSLGNVCNFKCVICSPNQSHLILKEKYPDNNSYIKNQGYFDFLIENIPKMKNLHSIQFTGGEPFYNKKILLDILSKLPDKVEIHPLRTNGSIFDKDIMESVKRFSKVRLAFSYDSYGKTIEYQRPNCIWPEMEQTLEKFLNFREQNKNIIISNDFTVTWINVDTIPDFHKKFKDIFAEIRYHPILFPTYWMINLLKPEYQKEILKSLVLIKEADPVRKHINEYLNNEISEKEINILWNNIEYMKKHRNVSLEEKIPHIIPFLRKTSLQLS